MRKLLTTAFIVIFVVASSFASDVNKVNASINFNYQFRKAANISWTTHRDFLKVDFTLNNSKMEAFYNFDGEFIGSSIAIDIDELPVKAKRTFARNFEEYTVKDVIRFDGAEEGAYFISAENEIGSVIIKVDDFNKLSVFKRDKK